MTVLPEDGQASFQVCQLATGYRVAIKKSDLKKDAIICVKTDKRHTAALVVKDVDLDVSDEINRLDLVATVWT